MDVIALPFPCNGYVRLNVGGKLFTTTVETLVYDSEFFKTLRTTHLSTAADSSGAFLVDRNGDLFAVLLEYLRTRVCILTCKCI